MKNIKDITKAVDQHFNNGLSLDDTCELLYKAGIKVKEFETTIKSIGLKNEWILTPEKIDEKISEFIKGKKVKHFLDILNLAEEIELPQVDQKKIQNKIFILSGAKASDVKQHAKFKKLFNPNGKHGCVIAWIEENPNFKPDELIKADPIAKMQGSTTTPENRLDYYEEINSYFYLADVIMPRFRAKA